MRDYNFFERHINQRRSSQKKSLIFISAVMAAVLVISGSYAAVKFVSAGIRADTEKMKIYLDSDDISAKWEEIQDQKKRLDLMTRYLSAVKAVKADIDGIDVVNSSFLVKINEVLPKDIVLDSMSVTSTSLSLKGSADSRMSVAELLHNLDSLGAFSSVSAGGINAAQQGAERYTFDIKCSIKGAETK